MSDVFDRLGSKLQVRYPDTAESGDAYDVESWSRDDSELKIKRKH